MKKLKAILVDDEEAARNVLEQLLNRNCPSIEVVEKCHNVPSAVEQINLHQPDVVFLDVQMPNYAGYEIVNFFEEINFEIIFVTAYDQYAIKAFELSAIDYLVKPINRQRLIEAVEKLATKVEEKSSLEKYKILEQSMNESKIDKIVISELGNQRVIKLEDIIAIEAGGAYSTIHLQSNKPVIISKNLKQFEAMLPEDAQFVRTHKSWIIHLNHLVQYSKTELEIELTNGLKAKLSKYKKAEFEEQLV